jgi:hypothetical protein
LLFFSKGKRKGTGILKKQLRGKRSSPKRKPKKRRKRLRLKLMHHRLMLQCKQLMMP